MLTINLKKNIFIISIFCLGLSCASPSYPVQIQNAKLIPKSIAIKYLVDYLPQQLISSFERSFFDIESVNVDKMRISFDDNIQHNYTDLIIHYTRVQNSSLLIRILEDYLIIRTGPVIYEDCLTKDNVRVFDLTGRTMKGWIVVDAPGLEEDEDLLNWINKGLSFARTLPVKA